MIINSTVLAITLSVSKILHNDAKRMFISKAQRKQLKGLII